MTSEPADITPERAKGDVRQLLTPTELDRLDGHRRFSGSELRTFKRCRRKWWLTYFRGLQLRREEPVGPKYIGDRIHRALAFWYAPPGVERRSPREALEELIESDREALLARHGVSSFDAESIGPELLKKFTDDANLERIMIAGYAEWLAETGADSEYEVVAPEAYLEADLPGSPGIKIIAKIDARVRRVADDARMWLEHKTVGSFGQRLNGLQQDEQTLFQTLVERLQPESGRVAGVLYNMLRRVKRTASAKPPFYQRLEIMHSPSKVDAMHRQVAGTIDDIIHVHDALTNAQDHHNIAYPNPTGDCAWDCPFVAVCSIFDDDASGERVEAALQAYYVVGDPYGYYLK